MRIGIDCYAMQDPASAERGIGRYARDLTRALLDAAPDDEFIMFAVDGMDAGGIPWSEHTRPRLIPRAARGFGSDALNSWVANNDDRLDALVVLSPLQSHVEAAAAEADCRLVSVVYDLIPEVLPGIYSQEPAYREAYEAYLATVRDYDQLLTMSESARADLIGRRRFDPRKVVCAGAAANPLFTPAADDAERDDDRDRLRALGIFRPGYVLNVGHEDPRKGSRILAEAFSMLPEDLQSSTRLVFAYAASETHKEEIRSYAGTLGMREAIGDPALLDELGISPAVHFAGWCDDVSLRALYRNAAVMVFPSLYEGFGLPILEAMRCGCPVVCGDNSSQPEVGWPAAVLCDASDPDTVASATRLVLENPKAAVAMRRLGVEKAAAFAWPDVAAKALAAIRGSG